MAPFHYLAMRKLSSSLFVFVRGFAFGTCSPRIPLRRCQQSTNLLWKVLILGAVVGFAKGRYFGDLPKGSLKRRSWKDNTSFLVGNMSHLLSIFINMYIHIERAQSIPVPRRLHECSTGREVAPIAPLAKPITEKRCFPEPCAKNIPLHLKVFFKKESYTRSMSHWAPHSV